MTEGQTDGRTDRQESRKDMGWKDMGWNGPRFFVALVGGVMEQAPMTPGDEG